VFSALEQSNDFSVQCVTPTHFDLSIWLPSDKHNRIDKPHLNGLHEIFNTGPRRYPALALGSMLKDIVHR